MLHMRPNFAVSEAIEIADGFAMPWSGIDTARDGNVGGPCLKMLRQDPEHGNFTCLLHAPPGWHDPNLDWHPTVEEAFTLAGTMEMGGQLLGAGAYLYRPPGILHGPVATPDDGGATFLIRKDGEMRILRYDGDEFPHAHGQPITPQLDTWPIEYTEKIDTDALAWDLIAEGPWAGASIKWLSRHRETGGGTVMLSLPAGWSGAGSPANGQAEEFVLDGSFTAGGTTFRRWGFALRPEGAPAGRYETAEGATLLCFWDRASELA